VTSVVEQSSSGDNWCIRADRRWIVFRPSHEILARRSLANEPLDPQVLWLFARRPA
jgi:hypothetical protein